MRTLLLFTALLSITTSLPARAATAVPEPALQLRVSIPEQKLYVFNGDKKVSTFRVSTSAFGIGDGTGTYSTPLGQLAIAAKVGDGAPIGTVFKGRCRTGEICEINAKGRDPIVTRILHLRGLEKQNSHAYGRGIYIHGTPEERRIGRPASYGCIRMKSKDVVALYDMVGVGTRVEITDQRISAGLFSFISGKSSTSSARVAAKVGR